MGCGCAGSQHRLAVTQEQARTRIEKVERPRRTGGPGDPGYYWTGPDTPPTPAPQTPEPQKA